VARVGSHVALALVISACRQDASHIRAAGFVTADELRAITDSLRAEIGVPGLAVAVTRSDGPAVSAVAGVRDISTGTAVQPGDVFEIGSVSKSVTATALARLVERGTLSWSTKLSDLPQIGGMRHEYRGVTLPMLLRHRSGITRLQSPDADMERELDRLHGTAGEQRAALTAWMLGLAPELPPGAGYRYSNGDYVVAGRVAELASGMEFDAVLRREVFEPLGMTSARVDTVRRSDETRGHVVENGRMRDIPIHDNPYQLPLALQPAGAVRSSVDDLVTFARAHLQGLRGRDGFLRAATVAELHRPEPGPTQSVEPFGHPVGYAAGWVVFKLANGHRVSWHNGSAGSFFAWVTILPDDDAAIAVLTNVGGRDPGEIVCRAATQRVLARMGLALN